MVMFAVMLWFLLRYMYSHVVEAHLLISIFIPHLAEVAFESYVG